MHEIAGSTLSVQEQQQQHQQQAPGLSICLSSPQSIKKINMDIFVYPFKIRIA